VRLPFNSFALYQGVGEQADCVGFTVPVQPTTFNQKHEGVIGSLEWFHRCLPSLDGWDRADPATLFSDMLEDRLNSFPASDADLPQL